MGNRKTYTYNNIVVPVGDDEDVEFSVVFVSDGNEGTTTINIPGGNDPEIQGAGTQSLGTGQNLRGGRTITSSVIYNAAADEDEISVNFLINGKVVQEHMNPKSESDWSTILLVIQFPPL